MVRVNEQKELNGLGCVIVSDLLRQVSKGVDCCWQPDLMAFFFSFACLSQRVFRYSIAKFSLSPFHVFKEDCR